MELTHMILKYAFWGDWRPSLLPKDFADECDTQLAFADIKDGRSRQADAYRYNILQIQRLHPDVYTNTINVFKKGAKLQEKLYCLTLLGIGSNYWWDRVYYTHKEYTDEGKINWGHMRMEKGKTKPYKRLYVKSWSEAERYN
jgi:hypothetical protein